MFNYFAHIANEYNTRVHKINAILPNLDMEDFEKKLADYCAMEVCDTLDTLDICIDRALKNKSMPWEQK